MNKFCKVDDGLCFIHSTCCVIIVLIVNLEM
jgi:hypothetical protein